MIGYYCARHFLYYRNPCLVFDVELGSGYKMEEFLRVEDFDGLATFCEHAELEAGGLV